MLIIIVIRHFGIFRFDIRVTKWLLNILRIVYDILFSDDGGGRDVYIPSMHR